MSDFENFYVPFNTSSTKLFRGIRIIVFRLRSVIGNCSDFATTTQFFSAIKEIAVCLFLFHRQQKVIHLATGETVFEIFKDGYRK